MADSPANPLADLREWIEEARAEGVPHPASVAFVTVGADSRPSARTVTMKRLEEDALVFTTALWTRKAKEVEVNPHVALLFHWPGLGRQAHITGKATLAERSLAKDLFAAPRLHERFRAEIGRTEDDQTDRLADLSEQMGWLRDAGFVEVDCHFKWLELALVVAVKG